MSGDRVFDDGAEERLRSSIEWCESGVRECNEKMSACFREIDELTASRANYEFEIEECTTLLADLQSRQDLNFSNW